MVIPSRYEWTKMTWDEAQANVVQVFNSYGFTTLNETRLPVGRADGLVFCNRDHEVLVGIVEVKHYQHVTKTLYKNSVIQGLKYLRSIYPAIRSKYTKPVRYFIAAVYTNDYPAGFSFSEKQFADYIPSELSLGSDLEILLTPVDTLIDKLKSRNLIEIPQSTLDDFFS